MSPATIPTVEVCTLETDILSDVRETMLRLGADEAPVVQAVRELRLRWGSQEIYVQSIDREQRDRTAREALARGASLDEAARLAGCSTTTIRRRSSKWL
ncbi:MAG: hypothetical protein EOM91_19995 [Sphingobacteriia bacterium]|nr:hypothetical protein [Sphingobacteriia bacterium]